VRTEIVHWEGIEIDRAGDGFFVRFDTPARAIECARAVRTAAKRLSIDIRAGIHTGECELQSGKVAGMAVHIAARAQGVANPGEILVSRTVTELATGSGTRFEDRGLHVLKGVPGEWRLFSVSD
jgi:class 3 adenylate cyclase